jgi:hypothetical protein
LSGLFKLRLSVGCSAAAPGINVVLNAQKESMSAVEALAMPSNWLTDYLDISVQRGDCTKIDCATCGAEAL